MIRQASRERRTAPPTIAALSVLLAVFLSASLIPASAEAQAAAGGARKEAEPTQPETSPTLPKTLLEPPDGNWLVDEAGIEYFTFELPKRNIRYRRVNEDTIRLARGPHLKVAAETDTTFTIKIINSKSIPIPEPAWKPTEEEIAAAAASYRADFEEVDRLSFEPFDEGLPRHGLWRNGFDVADMNGDGHLDIVHGPARKSGTTPVIFLGDSKGSWELWETDFAEAPYDYGDVVTADFNRDGKQDVAFAIHARGAIVLIGNNKGSFKIWSKGIELEQAGHDGLPAFTSRSLTATDWNRDGLTDLVVLSEGPRGFEHVGKNGSNGLMFYQNRGDGSWAKHLDKEALIFGDNIKLADVDGDGTIEVVTSTSHSGERNLVNKWLGDGVWKPQAIDVLRPSALIWSIAVGDFDGDDRDDVAVGYRNRELGVRRTGIDVYLARDEGQWERKPMLSRKQETGQIDVHAMATGDVDGDEKRDLVATSRDGRLFLFLGDGKGGFVREVDESMETPLEGCRGYGLEVVDLDGQAGGEIIATFSGESCPEGGSILAWTAVPSLQDAPVEEAASAHTSD